MKMKMKMRASTSILQLFGILMICCGCLRSEGEVSLEPDTIVYVVTGREFQAKCIMKDVTSPNPIMSFVDSDNKALTPADFSNNRLVINSTTDGTTLTKIFTLNPVELEDKNKIQGMACLTDSASHGYSLYVIPEESVPEISMSPKEVETVKGEDVQIVCEVSAKTTQIVTGVKTKWTKLEVRVSNLISSNSKYEITDVATTENGYAKAKSTLIIKNVKLSDVGKYFCVADLDITDKSETIMTFNKAAEITSVILGDTGKVEVESKIGEDAAIVCTINGSPKPVLQWKKNDDVITADTDSRYVFTNSTEDDANLPNSKFIIKDVTFGDRALYKCIGMFKNESGVLFKEETRDYRLRVRDPLGALWPTIGIIVEVVLLIIIIALYELYKQKTKKRPKGDQVDGGHGDVNTSEKSPLVTNAPVVSYTVGEDGVRERSNAGTAEA